MRATAFPLPSYADHVGSLVSTKVSALESKDALKRRIDEASKYVPLERLALHDAQILPNGNITMFANGMTNMTRPLCSRVLELDARTGDVVMAPTRLRSAADFRDPSEQT